MESTQSTGVSPPRAESSLELSESSGASQNKKTDSQSCGRSPIVPLVGRPGSYDLGAQALNVGAFVKIDTRRGRQAVVADDSDEDMSALAMTIRRAIRRDRRSCGSSPQLARLSPSAVKPVILISKGVRGLSKRRAQSTLASQESG